MSLHEDVLITTLGEWLELDDVGALDTACCNKKLRSGLLGIMSLEHFVCESLSSRTGYAYFSWLLLRKVGVHDIFLSAEDDVDNGFKPLGSIVLQVVRNMKNGIRRLTAPFGPLVLEIISLVHGNIETFDMSFARSPDKDEIEVDHSLFSQIFSKMPNLQVLNIPAHYELTERQCEIILMHCPNLHMFSCCWMMAPMDFDKIIAQRLSKLSSLYISQMEPDMAEITETLTACHSLTSMCMYIYLGEEESASCELIDELMRIVTKLKTLKWKMSPMMNGQEMTKFILQKCVQLTELSLLDGKTITDVELLVVSANCKSLTRLSVHSSRVTDMGVCARIYTAFAF